LSVARIIFDGIAARFSVKQQHFTARDSLPHFPSWQVQRAGRQNIRAKGGLYRVF
jgi:hypothetical protein